MTLEILPVTSEQTYTSQQQFRDMSDPLAKQQTLQILEYQEQLPYGMSASTIRELPIPCSLKQQLDSSGDNLFTRTVTYEDVITKLWQNDTLLTQLKQLPSIPDTLRAITVRQNLLFGRFIVMAVETNR